MKLTIVGGGGFRVPLIYSALLADRSPGRITEVRLLDIDADRLATIQAVLAEMAAGQPEAPTVEATTDPASALDGADFVFLAIRVGGTFARARDEQLASLGNLMAQETVGACGIAYALRTIPKVLELCREIRTHAPNAWIINFTNPAGLITQVMREELGGRVVGICDSPVGLVRRVLATLKGAGVVAADVPDPFSDTDRVVVGYLGLNHLGWLTELRVDGVNVLPRLGALPGLIESFEEGKLFGADNIRLMRAVPNEYLHYYELRVRSELSIREPARMRGHYLAKQQARFYREARTAGGSPLAVWQRARAEREQTYMAVNRELAGGFERAETDIESGGYEQVALALMHALANNRRTNLILNTVNDGVLPRLPATAVVETMCRVDASGWRPLTGFRLREHMHELIEKVKFSEDCTIAAARTGSRGEALVALRNHPLVANWTQARNFLSSVIEEYQLDYLR